MARDLKLFGAIFYPFTYSIKKWKIKLYIIFVDIKSSNDSLPTSNRIVMHMWRYFSVLRFDSNTSGHRRTVPYFFYESPLCIHIEQESQLVLLKSKTSGSSVVLGSVQPNLD